MENREIITLILAVWGALLSTYKVVSDYWKNRTNMKVKLSYGVIGRPGFTLQTFIITAINTGSRAINLHSAGLLLPSELQYISVDPLIGSVQFPYTLLGEDSCRYLLDYSKLVQHLNEEGFSGEIKLKGFYKSAIGKVFESKPFKFDTK